jgi:carbonic anhydrase
LANDGSTVRIRIAAGSTLQIGEQIYALHQFHFHTPGGEAIAGTHYPMVAHLLHKSSSGQLVAVAVHFIAGAHNDLMESVLTHIPAHANGDHAISGVHVDATALLPRQRGYYRYTGSLTAEPCTEGVDWIVLKQPIELSLEQLTYYKHLFRDNMRNLQPANQRRILESE